MALQHLYPWVQELVPVLGKELALAIRKKLELVLAIDLEKLLMLGKGQIIGKDYLSQFPANLKRVLVLAQAIGKELEKFSKKFAAPPPKSA